MSNVVAAEPTTAAAAAPAPGKAAAKDLRKLSKEGSKAFNDVSQARLALFDGKPEAAVKLIKEAQQSLKKAKADDTAFLKAESEMKGPASEAAAAKAAAAAPVQWLPVAGEVSIGEDISKNSAKVDAVDKANSQMKSGDRDGAMETLRLADIKVIYTLAAVPLQKTIADVDTVDGLLTAKRYYEANLAMKRVQDAVRYASLEETDKVAPPAKAGGTAAVPAEQGASAAQAAAAAPSAPASAAAAASKADAPASAVSGAVQK
ncbi:YfdX family protein [Trinickia terrae]|nr:YfdX family protein [Trinickia terrae]